MSVVSQLLKKLKRDVRKLDKGKSLFDDDDSDQETDSEKIIDGGKLNKLSGDSNLDAKYNNYVPRTYYRYESNTCHTICCDKCDSPVIHVKYDSVKKEYIRKCEECNVIFIVRM